jgi:1-acyl-sn-glycerol-3-phosphate acyltransferase
MKKNSRYTRTRLELPRAAKPTLLGLGLLGVVSLALPAATRTLVDLERTERLPGGPLVVVSNHRSVADGPLIFWALTRAGRMPHMLGTAGLFTVPVLGRLFLKMGMVPVKRRTPRAHEALEDATRLASAGGAVGLFPEGKVNTLDEEEVGELRTGAARIALASGAQVAVLAFSGASEVVPPPRWRPVLGRHKVSTSLRVISVTGDASDRGDVKRVTAEIGLALSQEVRTARAKRVR